MESGLYPRLKSRASEGHSTTRHAVLGASVPIGTERWSWRLPPSPFPMWIFDARTGAILAANDAAVNTYGYSQDELLACSVTDLCPPQTPGGEIPSAHRGIGPAPNRTLLQRRKDGSTFEADIAAVETGDGEHPATMVLVNPRAGEKEGTPSDLHPRAPVRRGKTLLGRPRAIAHLIEPGTAHAVSARSTRGADLHALSWDPSAFVSVDAREVAEQVVGRVRHRADAKDVDVVVHCTCARVSLQAQAFGHALYELLDNAVQATRRGYPVMIDIRETGEGDVLWQIQDAGEGMSEQVLAHLGQPSAGAAPGSGLGVALAWALIEMHGGLLRFESAPGVGSTASIWLPGTGRGR